MPVSGATAREQKFRVWIRRRNEPQGPYAIRFEVPDGKGILRVVRPGVLVDPPARPSGFEERLTASQVRASRFLHVWEGGRYRQGYLLARLEEAGLESLPADRWIELFGATEGSTALLQLPVEIGPDSGVVDDEPTWPRREMLAGLQRELRDMGDRAPADAEEWATEVRTLELPEPRVAPGQSAASRPPPDPIAPEGEARPRRAETVDVPRTAPPRPVAPLAAAAPSLDDWLGSSGGNMDEDRTVVMRAPGSQGIPLRPTEAPRASLSALLAVPALPTDPAEEFTTLQALDVEALEALEDNGAPGFDDPAFGGPGFEDRGFDSRGFDDPAFDGAEGDAIEAFESTTDPPSSSGTIEALEAGDEDEEDVEVVEEPEVTDVGRRTSDPRRVLTEAVTVMPHGAQELAADVAARAAGPAVDGVDSGSTGVATVGVVAAARPGPRPAVDRSLRDDTIVPTARPAPAADRSLRDDTIVPTPAARPVAAVERPLRDDTVVPAPAARPVPSVDRTLRDDTVVPVSNGAARRAPATPPLAAEPAAPPLAAESAVDARGGLVPPRRPPARAHAAEPDRVVDLHERNTTLVRHLRRRIADDRTRIAVLEQRVAELEAELARRTGT